jgi:hypothetical protein
MKRSVLKQKTPLKKVSSKSSVIKKTKKELDQTCREIAHIKYKEQCITCSANKNRGDVMQWAHFLTAAAHITRWDSRNWALQCRSCNMRHEYDFSHYMTWFLRTYGQDEYDSLALLHHSGKKLTILELDMMLKEKKNELARLLMRQGESNHGIDEIPY